MKKTSLFIVPFVLLLSGPAAAKTITAVRICGADGCLQVKDPDVRGAFEEGGPPTDPPKERAPWYRVSVSVREGRPAHDTFSYVLVPSLRMIRSADFVAGGAQWMPISARGARIQGRAASDLEPFRPRS